VSRAATAVPSGPRSAESLGIWLLPAAALLAGVAVGSADKTLLFAIGGVAALAIVAWSASRPAAAMHWIAAQTVFFPVVPVFEGRGFNPLDLLMPGALAGAWFLFLDRPAQGAGATEIERGRRGIVRAGTLYYVLAVLSLLVLGGRHGRWGDAMDSMLVLTRSLQGALFFFLVSRLGRTAKDLARIRNGVLFGLGVAFALNVWSMLAYEVPRAGAVWALGETTVRSGAAWAAAGMWTVTNPNELSMGCLLAFSLLLAMPLRSRGWNGVALALTTVLLILTLSRAGLGSWLALVLVFGIRGGHRALWLLPVVLALAFPLLPEEYTGRMLRTATLERGSFEAYSSLIRVFCWQTSFQTFLANPIFGVGYLGFRFVAAEYNTLGLELLTSESFFLETASGMGVIGLAALATFTWALVAFARRVPKHAEKGSVAERFARVTPAYLIAIGLANLTGDLLIGLLSVSQLALFTAFVTQSARIPELRVAPPQRARRAPAPAPAGERAV
jgi:hypothetical protein